MVKKDNRDWLRMVLAFVAVLLVAGPGLVLAGSPSSSYPYATNIIIAGSHNVTAGSTGNAYTVTIKMSDGTQFAGNGSTPGLSFSASRGTVTGTASGLSYDAPATTGLDTISAHYTAPGSSSTVTGNKVVNVTP
jgi:hypothetical protein